MGLSCVCDSDMASDLAADVMEVMVKRLLKGLKEKSNEFNTLGCVNVALFIEEYMPFDLYPWYEDYLIELATKTKESLKKVISEVKSWESDSNREFHLKAYNRMVKNLDKCLERS